MNKYCNLYGQNKIKDEYTKINSGFELVQADIDPLIVSEASREEAETQREVNEANRQLRYSNTKHYGEYNPATVYHTNNIVSYFGSTYMLKENPDGTILESQGYAPPTYPVEENERWKMVGKKGDKGDAGAIPNIQIGTVTTLEPGNPATVNRRSESPDTAPVFDFAIPKGIDGTGAGDMLKNVYDTDNDGVVDDSEKLGGQLPSYYAINNVVNVKAHGATGDGVTDDTAAIQSAIDSVSGRAILFFPTGNYKANIEVPSRFSILGQGGGSRIMPFDSGWGIKMAGTHTGTAAPSSRTETVINEETYPYIKDIRIQGDGITTGGIQIDKLMQPVISGVFVEGCSHGIQIVNRSRNIIIDKCHIYNNYGPGVHVASGTDIHQLTISNSIINYCKRTIYLDNCDLRNMLVANCDLEYSDDGANISNVEIDVSTSGVVRFVTISGCQLEGLTANGQMINLKGNTDNIKNLNTIVISGSYINNFETGGIGIRGNYCSSVQISGNNLSTNGRAVIFDHSSNIDVTGGIGGSYSSSTGIHFGAENEYVTINGVQLCDVGSGQAAALSLGSTYCANVNNCMVINPPAVGILLNGATNSIISNCIVLDTRETKVMSHPIRELSPSNKNIIANNRVNSGATGGITKAGADTVVSGNLEMD